MRHEDLMEDSRNNRSEIDVGVKPFSVSAVQLAYF